MIYELRNRNYGKYRFSTVNGSKYFFEITPKKKYFYRINDLSPMENDHQKIEVLNILQIRMKESALFVLNIPNNHGGYLIRVTTMVTAIELMEPIEVLPAPFSDANFYLPDNDEAAEKKFFCGDFVKFNFNDQIHYGQISVVDANGGGIYWGVTASYDIMEDQKMLYKHVPHSDILELISRED